jgi:hypothetical protein
MAKTGTRAATAEFGGDKIFSVRGNRGVGNSLRPTLLNSKQNPYGRISIYGQVITLGAGTANPVTITFKALNGNGIETDNENDECGWPRELRGGPGRDWRRPQWMRRGSPYVDSAARRS